jgi:hypothetical protein
MCVDFYFKLILINKFIKHNQVNHLYCDIKYLDIYIYISQFFQFFLFKKKITKPYLIYEFGKVFYFSLLFFY